MKTKDIPKGYKDSPVGVIPEDWQIVKAGQIFHNSSIKIENKNEVLLSVTQDLGVIPREMLDIRVTMPNSNKSSFKLIEKGDFVISLRSFQGGIEYSNYKGIVSPAYTVLKTNKKIYDLYYKYYFKSQYFIARLAVAVFGIRDGKQISYKDFKDIKIHYPPLDEQEKIAKILLTWDKAIEKQTQLIEKLEERKKGLNQQLLTGKKRLPGFSGDWKEVKLKAILRERKEYEKKGKYFDHVSLTIDGVVPKTDRYNRDFLVKKEGKEYKVTYLNDICYNPANLKFGVICKNNYGSGIFSPIYVTFEIKKGFNIDFIANILTSTDFINIARKYEEGTVYERMSVKPNDLLKLNLKLPIYEEQQAIAKILNYSDIEIEINKNKLNQFKLQKKGLMQQLLTGKKRVKF